MRRVWWAPALAFALLVLSCQKQPAGPEKGFTVQGRVYYLGAPAAAVTVSIDKKADWTVKTDSSGHFEIENVSSGKHQMKLRKDFTSLPKSLGGGVAFSERTVIIVVSADTILDFLKLPKPVILHEAREITESSATLSWSPTEDEGFREYKLYRHDSPGLDETTGTLVYVSTSRNDTTYRDEGLQALRSYYYRVYVMNEYGRIGGSNIVEVKTRNVQLVRNGGFEEVSNGYPKYWTIQANSFGNPENSITIDTVGAFEGKNSLRFFHAEPRGCWEMWITQSLRRALLDPGARYRLTLAVKGDFTGGMQFDLLLRNPAIDLRYTVQTVLNNENEWTNVSYDFALPENISNNDVEMWIDFCIAGIHTWWLDDISLERVE